MPVTYLRHGRIASKVAMGAAAAVLSASFAVAQIPNGGFETGNLTGWTAAGSGQVEVLRESNFSPAVTPPEGTYFALLSTGPGTTNGVTGDYDSNGVPDYDAATLSITFTVTSTPASLSFMWAFLTSEGDQPADYDDFFDVQLNGTVILGRSVYKPGGVSPYPDTPPTDNVRRTVTSNGATDGSTFNQGTTPFQLVCVPLPAPGKYTLQFRVADQGDTLYDSGLLVDAVQLGSVCTTPLQQITVTSGAALEAKGGALVYRPVINRDAALNGDGSALAFVSSGNLTGDNPNAQTQLFTFRNNSFKRLTSLVGRDVSKPSLSSDGRWIAFASDGDITPGSPGNSDGNFEIFRFDMSSGTFAQITNTAAPCQNTSPSISGDGTRIAFLTNCSDLVPGFNGDGNTEVVVWDGIAGTIYHRETTGCINRLPMLSPDTTSAYVAFTSSCNYTGGNADGNFEVFLWTLPSTFTQVTTSAATVTNDVASVSSTAAYLAFLSDGNYAGQNAAGRLQVFRWTRAPNTFQQVTSAPTNKLYTFADIDSSGRYIAAERLDTGTFLSETVLLDTATAGSETGVLSGSPDGNFPVVAVSGSTPVVALQSSADPLGSNADANSEIWSTSGTLLRNNYCSAPNVAIPDNRAAGVSDSISVTDVGTVANLTVFVQITHPYVGDLSATLQHTDGSTNTTVTLFNRPGRVSYGNGCSGDNILVTLADSAGVPVQNLCSATPPAIVGTAVPVDALAAFAGQNLRGTWTLNVADHKNKDTGTLVRWCLAIAKN